MAAVLCAGRFAVAPVFTEPQQPAAGRCCPLRRGPGGPASAALGPGRTRNTRVFPPLAHKAIPRRGGAGQPRARTPPRQGRAAEARRQRGRGGAARPSLLCPRPGPARRGPPAAPTVSESVLRCWKARAPNTKPESRAEVLSPSMPAMAGRAREGGREPPAAAGGRAAPGPGPQGARPPAGPGVSPQLPNAEFGNMFSREDILWCLIFVYFPA